MMIVVNETTKQVLKLYAWETSFEQKILEKRQDELDVFKKMSIYAAGSSFLWTCSPLLVSPCVHIDTI